MNRKQLLRGQRREQEKHLKGSDFSQEDQATCEALLSSRLYKHASWIFAFYPLATEVNIKPILQDAIAHKHLALPVCEADNSLVFHEVTTQVLLQKGPLGIIEPQEGRQVVPTQGTLILVPALAFTAQRERLGRGKGYYDRFLQSWSQIDSLGICRKHQLVTELPLEPWDQRVGTLLCGGIFF
ncbi:MAG: 5-formyltetrahydrofolate cyclo-ligase [Sphaerochaetaceae bacterium]